MKIEWTKEQLMKANDKLIRRNRRYKNALGNMLTEGEFEDVNQQLERILEIARQALEESK